MNAVVEYRAPQLSAVEIRAHVNLIQEVMKGVMKKDVHYGVVPGTDKPSLLKPGAEKLCETFRIAPSYQIEDLSGKGFIRYRIRCIGTHQTTGILLGEGMGACSSLEEKYKWRKAYQREFDATTEDRRRTKFGYNKSERREYEILQVRTEPADLENTILKMACKRALVGMTITVTAAGDIFTQDIEDLPPELVPTNEEGGQTEKPKVEQPSTKGDDKKANPQDDEPIKENQLRILRAKMKNVGLGDADLVAKFGAIDKLKFGQFQAIQAWISEGGKGG